MSIADKQYLSIVEHILDYNTNKDIGAEAIIPMERIHGPILLISTEADTVWPSVSNASCSVLKHRRGMPMDTSIQIFLS